MGFGSKAQNKSLKLRRKMWFLSLLLFWAFWTHNIYTLNKTADNTTGTTNWVLSSESEKCIS